jgi:hypothetical protein
MRNLLWVILLGLTVRSAAAQDPAVVSPSNYKVEIENEWVRVLRLKQGPHEKTPFYESPASVVVYLSDSDQQFTGPDGRTQEARHKIGEASYFNASKHSQVNLSSEPLEEVIVELKSGAPKGSRLPPAALDPVKVEPEYATSLFENDRVRVLHTVLAPHVKNPLHAHPHNVVVFAIAPPTITLADGKTVDNPRKAGVVRWVEATQHSTENTSDKPTLEIQVELK